MRQAEINRKTGETDISLSLSLDGNGKCEINTGCGFLNHMLELFAKHSRFDLNVSCIGDTDVDYHHTVEVSGGTAHGLCERTVRAQEALLVGVDDGH